MKIKLKKGNDCRYMTPEIVNKIIERLDANKTKTQQNEIIR